MLNQQQLDQARKSLGITPIASPTNDRTTALQQAWGTSTPATPPSPVSSIDNPTSYQDFVGKAQLEGGKNIAGDIKQGADTYQKGVDKMGQDGFLNKVGGLAEATGGLLESGMNTASDALMTLFAPVTGGVNYIADKLSNIPQLQKFATGPVGDALQKVQDHISSVAQANPRLAKDLSSAFNLALAGIGEGATTAGEGSLVDVASKSLAENTPDIVGNLKSTAGDMINTAKTGINDLKTQVGSELNTAKNTLTDVAGNVKNAIKPALTPEEATGQIIQGEKAEIPAAQRTFEALKDTSNIKSQADLSKAIDEQIIKPGLKQVDAEFAKDTSGGHSIKSFEQTVGKGKGAVKVNYVQDAIQQLKDFYTKTGDAEGLSKLKTLENKAKINGLTYGDINNLAREHGSTLNSYNANGELSSGLTKQAAENTRQGLKSTARNGLGTP